MIDVRNTVESYKQQPLSHKAGAWAYFSVLNAARVLYVWRL